MLGDAPLTFRALKVSMNFSSSSGGRKSPMKCLPRPIFVSCSAHSAQTDGKGERREGGTALGEGGSWWRPRLKPYSQRQPCTTPFTTKETEAQKAKSCAQGLKASR